MKIIENRILPPKNYLAINLFGILFVRRGNAHLIDVYDLNHEHIHTRQMKEMLYIFFYMWYIAEWLVRLLRYFSPMEAYRNISFEREAYQNQHNLNYVNTKKFYSFIRYL